MGARKRPAYDPSLELNSITVKATHAVCGGRVFSPPMTPNRHICAKCGMSSADEIKVSLEGKVR